MRLLVFAALFLFTGYLSSAEEVGLRIGVKRFVASYSVGDWRGAGNRWLEMEGVFAAEPEWQVCVIRYSGAAGLALLFSDRPGEALRVLEGQLSDPSHADDLWLQWLRAVALEVLGRGEEAAAGYMAIAGRSQDMAAVLLARLRAAILARDMAGLERIATAEGALPSVRHAARFHLLVLLSEAGKPEAAGELALADSNDPQLITRPGLWHVLMRNIVIGSADAGADVVASLVGDRIQSPQVLQREIAVRRAGLNDDRQRLDGTLRGNIRAEYLRRLRQGLEADEALAKGSTADWLNWRLYIAEAYARAGRWVEAAVLWEAVYADSGRAGPVAERALLGLLGLAVEGDCVATVDAARSRYETAFPDGELRSEAVGLVAWWYYRAGRDRRARDTVHDYLRRNPAAAKRLPRLLLLSAYAALRLGEVEAARSDLAWAQKSGVRDVVYRARLAEALCASMDGNVEQALAQLRELRHEVQSPALLSEVYRQSLRVKSSTGRWVPALALIESYRDRVGIDIPWPELPLLEGDVLARLGDVDQAHDAYARAIVSGSDHSAAAVVRRGRLYAGALDWHSLASLLDRHLDDGTFDGCAEAVEALWLRLSAQAQIGPVADTATLLERRLPIVLRLPSEVDSLWLLRRIQNEGWLGDDSGAIDDWYEAHLNVQSTLLGYGACDPGRLAVAWAEHAFASGRAERGLEILCQWAVGMDPQCLAADVLAVAGERLAEVGDAVGGLFLATLDRNYPASRHRVVADVYFAKQSMLAGDFEEALERFERAAARSGSPALLFEATIGKAQALRSVGQLSAAAEILEQSLLDRRFRGHGHARALFLLGQWASDDGRLNRARGYFGRLVLLYASFEDITQSAQHELERLDVSVGGRESNEKAVAL